MVLIKVIAVRTAYPQNSLGIEVDNKKDRAVSTICLCFLSATPFCSEVFVHKVCCLVSSKASNSKNLLEVYSPPKSHLKHLIMVEC